MRLAGSSGNGRASVFDEYERLGLDEAATIVVQ